MGPGSRKRHPGAGGWNDTADRARAAVPRRLVAGVVAAAVTAGATSGCAGDRAELLLASTTSTEDSGLFEVLIPAFEAAHPGIEVHVTAIGTGQALELGRRGDADVLLVHAPAAESTFVAAGYGERRCEVMYNDFVILGPAADPAGMRGAGDAPGALRRIAETRSPFTSRGDDSGTHRKERTLWRAAGVEPTGDWYKEVGQGMAETLRMASETRGYTLSDRATFLNARQGLELTVLVEGDARLFNQYGVIPVSDATHPDAAAAFATWVTSAEAQDLIGRYGVERFGQPLFIPNATGCAPSTSADGFRAEFRADVLADREVSARREGGEGDAAAGGGGLSCPDPLPAAGSSPGDGPSPAARPFPDGCRGGS